MPEERVAKVWPLAPLDELLEEYLGLPATKTIVDVLPLPKKVMDALEIPTPGELIGAAVAKLQTKIEEKVK